MPRDSRLVYFVRGLLGGEAGHLSSDTFSTPDGRSATAVEIRELISRGVLAGSATTCRANTETAGWLKRARLDADVYAAQHRIPAPTSDGMVLNLAESPIARLASGESPFLLRHHLEAGERVRILVERAQLLPRVTMTYSASRTAGGQGHKADISDMAADARRAVARIHEWLPPDCASVVIDVCGFLKGLQDVERDRGWPRRSAKLVLRIGLDQLAQHYGIGAVAVGKVSAGPRGWMDGDARPTRLDLG